jgi:hypothetical protein
MRAGELLPSTYWQKFKISGTFTGYRYYSHYDSSGVKDCEYSQSQPITNHFTFTPDWGDSGVVVLEQKDLLQYIDYDIADTVVSNALQKLLSPTHDTATFLAELAKVVAMFKNAGRDLISLVTKPTWKKVANAELGGRYGWRTLAYDLEAIDEAIEHLSKTSPFWTERAGMSSSIQQEIVGQRTVFGNVLEQRTVMDIDISYRGIARGIVKPPSFGGNAAVTAWELIPYSFVIDWFFNIGTKISMIAGGFLTADFVSHYGIKVSVKSVCTASLVQASSDYTDNFVFQSSNGVARVNAELIVRRPYRPSLIPKFLIKLDAFKVVDIIALVYQALTRPK